MPGQVVLAIGASVAGLVSGAVCARRRRLLVVIAALVSGWLLLRAWLLWRTPDDAAMAEDWFNGLTVGWAGVELGVGFAWLALWASLGRLGRWVWYR